MNLLFINIALAATLFYYVWLRAKTKNLSILFLFILSIVALPELTNLINREEALTFSCISLFLGSLISFIKLPVEKTDFTVKIVARLLNISFLMTLCSLVLMYYNFNYPMGDLHNYLQIGIIIIFSALGFFVFKKALK